MSLCLEWTLGELLADWCDEAKELSCKVSGLALDSRQVKPGYAFLAVSGLRGNGLDYVADAIAGGAVALLVDRALRGYEQTVSGLGLPLCWIDDLAGRASAIAARFYGQPSRRMGVIGVTGTDGKSSVSHYLAQTLDQEGARAGIIGTLGNGLVGGLSPSGYTTPDAIRVQEALADLAGAGARWVVMEASSHGLAQGRLNAVDFNQAILTQLSRDHLDYHGSLEAYAAAKRKLFQMPGLEYAVLNQDDAFGRELLSGDCAARHCIGYSLEQPREEEVGRLVWARFLRLHEEGFEMEVVTPWGEGHVSSPLMGRFNAANLLAVLASLLALGVALAEAIERLRIIEPVPGRMERFGKAGGPVVIVDYAHTPAALESVLDSLRQHGATRLCCVFGAGGDRDRGKRPLMGAVAEKLSDRVIVTDDNPRNESPDAIVQDILAGLERVSDVEVIHDRAAAVRRALDTALPGEVVLIAGKGHESVQISGTETRQYSDRETVNAWFSTFGGAL